jgi:hypothetical protein
MARMMPQRFSGLAHSVCAPHDCGDIMTLRFTKKLLASESYEAAGVFDVDGAAILTSSPTATGLQGPDLIKRRAGELTPLAV